MHVNPLEEHDPPSTEQDSTGQDDVNKLEDEDPFLNDVWSLYFHDPNDANWNYDSYVRLTDISSIKEYWSIHHLLKPKLHCGMFFLMREYVFPCWDDENNRNGGCLSIKVLKQDLPQVWETISMRLIGEVLLQPKHVASKWNCVNGISTSPKKHFCIIKIWLKDNSLTQKEDYDLGIPTLHGEILYRSNQENILHNQSGPVAALPPASAL